MLTLWKNRVPMCIEVLLYSGCGHGSHHGNTQAEAMIPGSGQESCIMLEQWVLHVLPKRWVTSMKMYLNSYGKQKYSLPFIICPPPYILLPSLNCLGFTSFTKVQLLLYFMFNFTLVYPPPLLSANIFTSPKGGDNRGILYVQIYNHTVYC